MRLFDDEVLGRRAWGGGAPTTWLAGMCPVPLPYRSYWLTGSKLLVIIMTPILNKRTDNNGREHNRRWIRDEHTMGVRRVYNGRQMSVVLSSLQSTANPHVYSHSDSHLCYSWELHCRETTVCLQSSSLSHTVPVSILQSLLSYLLCLDHWQQVLCIPQWLVCIKRVLPDKCFPSNSK